MSPTPRPDLLTRASAGLLSAPAAVLVVAGAALFLSGDEALAGPAGLGAALGLLVFLPLLVAEYFAIFRGSRRAAATIAASCLAFAALGTIGWAAGLLDVLGLKSPGPDSMSPGEFAAFSAFLAGLLAAGLGHLRWHRLLASAPVEADGGRG